MTTRRKDIDDPDVRYMYDVEGKTMQEIADYYGVSKSCIQGRLDPEKKKESAAQWRMEHPEYAKQWCLEHPEHIKEYYQVNRKRILEYGRRWQLEHPEYKKEYYQDNHEKMIYQMEQWRVENPDYDKEYYRYNHEKVLERVKQWRLGHPEYGREYAKEWYKTNNGKAFVRRQNAKRRSLGSIELNEPFPNSEGHHIDEYYIIHIPYDLHRSIPHNVWTGEGMEAINTIAFGYITEEIFDKLISGDMKNN